MNLNMMPITATMGSVTGSPASATCTNRTETPTGTSSLKGTMIPEIPSITVTTSPSPNNVQGFVGQRHIQKSTSNTEEPQNSHPHQQHHNSPLRQPQKSLQNISNVSGDHKSQINTDRSNCF